MASLSLAVTNKASGPAPGTSKYGKQFGQGTIPLFKGTGKSGLTPIEAVDPSQTVTPQVQQ